MKKTTGFTLVELLVSITLLGFILLFAGSFQISSQKITTSVIDDTTLTEELRNAANIISDEVQRAIYIFPPCGTYATNANTTLAACDNAAPFPATYNPARMNVNFSKFVLGGAGADFTRRPGVASSATSSTWEVGVDPGAPILAMIVAPKNTSTTPTIASCGSGASDACYQFVAYFPVRRSQVSRSSSDPLPLSKKKLDESTANANTWVIIEYRASLLNTTNDVPATSANVPGGVGTVSFPPVTWSAVRAISTPGINPIPDALRQTINAIPAINAGQTSAFALASFTSRMSDTVTRLNGLANGIPNILISGIAPYDGTTSGFQVIFDARRPVTPAPAVCTTTPTDPSCSSGRNSVDERGAIEVKLRLQAAFVRNGKTVVVPTKPIEVFSSPRNIPY